jgi:hypothetical protein
MEMNNGARMIFQARPKALHFAPHHVIAAGQFREDTGTIFVVIALAG